MSISSNISPKKIADGIELVGTDARGHVIVAFSPGGISTLERVVTLARAGAPHVKDARLKAALRRFESDLKGLQGGTGATSLKELRDPSDPAAAAQAHAARLKRVPWSTG